MNVTDLPELMRERSAHGPEPVLADSRMAAIGRKVTAARRRTAGGLAGLMLLVMAVTLSAVAGLGGGHHRPAPPASTIDGFLEYANGGRLVSEETALYSGGGIPQTVDADDFGLMATSRCPAPPAVEIDLDIAVNGRHQGTMSCGSGGTYAQYPPAIYPKWHVTPGRPVTFLFIPKAFRLTLGAGGQTIGRTPTALPPGMFSVAVYQQIRFADYPLPPRPHTLPTLNVGQFGLDDTGMTTVGSDPNDPLAPKSLTLTLPAHCPQAGCLDMAVTAQTPGEIDIRIDGTLVSTARFWDYDGSGVMVTVVDTMQSQQPPYGDIHLTPGTQITVTITARYLTGAWEFAAAPSTR